MIQPPAEEEEWFSPAEWSDHEETNQWILSYVDLAKHERRQAHQAFKILAASRFLLFSTAMEGFGAWFRRLTEPEQEQVRKVTAPKVPLKALKAAWEATPPDVRPKFIQWRSPAEWACGIRGVRSELVAKTYGILAPKIVGASLTEKDLTSTSARLLHHAGTTFVGAVHLARGCFRRQYMVLIRSVIETIAVVIRLCADPKALANFYAGTRGSTKAVNAANKLFPVFGRIYGMLSNEFVHVGENQAAFERMGDYSKDDEDLKLILTSMKVTAWVMYVATELVFIEFVPRPRYWKIVAHHEDRTRVEVNYDPSEEERRWQAQFLGTDVSE